MENFIKVQMVETHLNTSTFSREFFFHIFSGSDLKIVIVGSRWNISKMIRFLSSQVLLLILFGIISFLSIFQNVFQTSVRHIIIVSIPYILLRRYRPLLLQYFGSSSKEELFSKFSIYFCFVMLCTQTAESVYEYNECVCVRTNILAHIHMCTCIREFLFFQSCNQSPRMKSLNWKLA